MKNSILALSVLMVCGLNQVHASNTLDISASDKEIIAQEIRKEALSKSYNDSTKKQLEKIAKEFESSQKSTAVSVENGPTDPDCVNCEATKKRPGYLARLGRDLGKGATWISTITAKPFMSASGFITGLFEKKDKNQDILALYKFLLNHQAEFDDLYLEAGTPDEMMSLIIAKMEEITEQKKVLIVHDLLASLGIKRERSDKLEDYALTAEEIASIDLSKLDPSLINNHPAYAELRPILGDVSEQDLEDIVVSNYFDKAMSFENYQETQPKAYEALITVLGKTIAPRVALNVVSKSLSGIYGWVTIPADIGTGVSAAICLQDETVSKFKADDDLRSFCSYVTNRSMYQLTKSRAKGYVAGKNSRAKIIQKAAERKERRKIKREEREAKKAEKRKSKEVELH